MYSLRILAAVSLITSRDVSCSCHTECHGRAIIILVSYSGNPRFKSLPEYWLCLGCSGICLSFSKQVAGQYCELRLDRWFTRFSQIVIHLSTYRQCVCVCVCLCVVHKTGRQNIQAISPIIQQSQQRSVTKPLRHKSQPGNFFNHET